MTNSEKLASMSPQLVADVTMYSTEAGGRKSPAFSGWGCPCCVFKGQPVVGYDGWPLLGESTLNPGDKRRLGFVFLFPEAAEIMKNAGYFYLWEGGFIGEAKVVIESGVIIDS
jgi:hypothetical protein